MRNRLAPFVVLLIVAVAVIRLAEGGSQQQRDGKAPARTAITGNVVRIADVDTLTVLEADNVQHSIRLFEIDVPESRHAFGSLAKEQLSSKVFGKTIRVEVVNADRYGRTVGKILLGDRNISFEMVADGFAWRYPQFDEGGEFTVAGQRVRGAKRGLRADPHPMPPWEFRMDKRDSARRQ